MKTLFLVRHAKSSWKDSDLHDKERPLNNRGKRDAPFMGKLLRENGIKLDLLVSSTATRAVETARFMARPLKYKASDIVFHESLYDCTINDILSVIHGIDDTFKNAMIIAHNPTITVFSNFIANAALTKFPTCGVLSVECTVESWKEVGKGSGIVRFFEYPKKYFK